MRGGTLYVADTNNEPTKLPDGASRPGNQQLLAFAIGPDGSVGPTRVLVDFAPGNGVHGLTVDTAGNFTRRCATATGRASPSASARTAKRGSVSS